MAKHDTGSMTETLAQELASELDRNVLERKEIDRLTIRYPALSLSDAYRIQELGIELRVAREDRVVGMKMGLTSKAKMRQVSVDSPIYGVLTRSMILSSGAVTRVSERIHPKIEPEIAFVLSKPLKGIVSADEALAACGRISAAMEIIDSRYRNFEFQLPDVIADNCSSSGFVIGTGIATPEDVFAGRLDLGNLGMVMSVDGKPAQMGSSAAIYGHPIESLRELCRMLSERGKGLEKGQIVLAGGATAAIELKAGTKIETEVQGLGKVSLEVHA